jgi:hypothetical protein
MTATFSRCQSCQEWHYDNEACRQIFMVYLHEKNGELSAGVKVHALNHDHAAKCYGVDFNHSNSFKLLRQHVIIDVVDALGKMVRYKVHAERKTEYHTEQLSVSAHETCVKH